MVVSKEEDAANLRTDVRSSQYSAQAGPYTLPEGRRPTGELISTRLAARQKKKVW